MCTSAGVFPHAEERGLMKGSGSLVGRGAAPWMEHSPAQVRDLLQGGGVFVSPVGMSIPVLPFTPFHQECPSLFHTSEPVSVVSGATEGGSGFSVTFTALYLCLCSRSHAKPP